MSRFASIKTARESPAALPSATDAARTAGRRGKKAVSGYFSVEMSKGLHLIALEQGVSLQALMGEAFDDLMRKYGKHPFGER